VLTQNELLSPVLTVLLSFWSAEETGLPNDSVSQVVRVPMLSDRVSSACTVDGFFAGDSTKAARLPIPVPARGLAALFFLDDANIITTLSASISQEPNLRQSPVLFVIPYDECKVLGVSEKIVNNHFAFVLTPVTQFTHKHEHCLFSRTCLKAEMQMSKRARSDTVERV
jgi:hypothetical protein